ncbi:PAS domain S-box protein [Pseudodesulfovibrio piezophilus]|uniref:histidine kinase n=1 Tax=Pseudodesulfovibrio piezophilus (strain DSM 21447 / JCM 15486 / C1TLV30) TaxID=1322246 RepID=M1WSP0_PSEP2|nr:PAS domain S-box protein [Pseudodesulfovibrio piezophilus]CCH49007.1 PAS/PAC sensor signal transduction histidine kinase [Pseudodesulfovibrio piezophilus C1TLV30]
MPRRIVYILPLLLGISLFGALVIGIYAEQERHAQKVRLEVFYKLSTLQGSFESGLNTRLQLAEAICSLVMLEPNLDQQVFSSFVRGLLINVSGVRSLELAKDNVTSHQFPMNRGSSPLGMTLLEDSPSDIQELVRRAMRTRQRQIMPPTATGQGEDVIVAATPVLLPGGEAAAPRIYWGVILMRIDANALYREAGMGRLSASLDVALRDPAGSQDGNGILFGRSDVFMMRPVVMSVPVPGGYWQMAAVPNPGWSDSPRLETIAMVGGGAILAVSGLLWATLYFLLNGLSEREKYRDLIQRAKSIILRLDVTGTISFCNEYGERFFGYAPGELVGKPLAGTLTPEKNLDGESMKRFIYRVLQNPAADLFNEAIHTRKTGEMVWVSWANESVLDRNGILVELLCVGTDITDRKLMEEALKQSERQYRMLADNVTDVIMGLDAEGRYTYVSPSDQALRGFGRRDVLSLPMEDFLTPMSGRIFAEGMMTLVGKAEGHKRAPSPSPSLTLDLEFLCADDTTVWLETRFGMLLNDTGELIGFQGVGRDITDRKRMEALRDDVERMARHDLKTPLGAVVGLPGEIRRVGDLSPVQETMLSTIENAGETMLQLINRSLDLFKMESGAYVLQKTSVDVLSVLECIQNETRTIVRAKGISIGKEVLDNPGADVFYLTAEEPLFRSMLSNLLLNALQASPPGGSVTVRLWQAEMVFIAIRNKGEVPDDIREVFFDKYSSAGSEGGSGLGTYSARLVARTHGGEITLDTSVPGETTITVSLPVSAAAVEGEPEAD